MWPFKNKSGGYVSDRSRTRASIEEARLIQRGEIMSQLKELQAWRGVRETFEYMGRCMVVTGYSSLTNEYGWLCAPQINARYCDNNGQIHEIRLNHRDVEHLMGDGDADSKAKE